MKKKHYPKKCIICFKVYEKQNKDTFGAVTYLNDFPLYGLEKGTCPKCKTKEKEYGRILSSESR
jgi:hypothetical protein